MNVCNSVFFVGSCNSSSPEEQDSSGCAGRVGQAVSNGESNASAFLDRS